MFVADNCSRRRLVPNPSSVSADSLTSVGRSLVGVRPEHTNVEVVIGVGPERIICIWPERIVDEVPIGIRPKQTAEPANHDDRAAVPPEPSTIAAPPVAAGKPAAKTCARQCPCAGCRGESIVAQKRRSPNAPQRAGHEVAVAIGEPAIDTAPVQHGVRSQLPVLKSRGSSRSNGISGAS